MESNMKLYGFPASPNTWKVRALAAHLGIPLDIEFVDLTKGASRTPAFLAINPTGRTPALVDGDFKLWESDAILQYIAAQKPNSLWPDDARARADIMRWQSWQLAHWSKEGCEPLLFQRLVKKIMNLGPPDEAVVAKGLECFNKEALVLDGHLAKQPYLVGKGITIADFSVAAPLFYAQQCDMPLAPYARVREWFGRVSALPCWQQTAPQFAAAA
jgi:glutathione S-transferase